MTRFKYLFLLTILGLIFMAMPVMAADIQVVVDGKVVEFVDQKPYIDNNDRTQVPLRAPMEAMGCEVSWNDSLQQAVISKGDARVEFIIGSNKYTINNDTKTMDTTAVITGNRTCIPIRYAVEAFGAEVDWIADKKAVAIYTKELTDEEKQELEKEIPEVKKPASEVVKYTTSTGRLVDVALYSADSFPLELTDTTILKFEKVKFYDEDFFKITQTGIRDVSIIENDITGKKHRAVGWGSGYVGMTDNLPNPDGTYSLYFEVKSCESLLNADKLIFFTVARDNYEASVIPNPLK